MARFRDLKAWLRVLLAGANWRQRLPELDAVAARQLPGPLFSLLLDRDELVRWRTLSSRLATRPCTLAMLMMLPWRCARIKALTSLMWASAPRTLTAMAASNASSDKPSRRPPGAGPPGLRAPGYERIADPHPHSDEHAPGAAGSALFPRARPWPQFAALQARARVREKSPPPLARTQ